MNESKTEVERAVNHLAGLEVDYRGGLEKEFPLKSEILIGKKTVTVFKVVEEVRGTYTPGPNLLSEGYRTPFIPGEVHLHWWSYGDSDMDLKIKVLNGGEIDILR